MIQKFEYKIATMEDIDELVRTRIIVLRAANKLSDDVDMSVVEEESYAYYMVGEGNNLCVMFHNCVIFLYKDIIK